VADISTGRLVLLSTLAGSGVAFGIMLAIAARAAFTVTRGHRWYQLKHL
jgi:hypothetical protein